MKVWSTIHFKGEVGGRGFLRRRCLLHTAPGFFVLFSERSKKNNSRIAQFSLFFLTAVTMHDRVVIFYGIHDATLWRGIGCHGVASAATAWAAAGQSN